MIWVTAANMGGGVAGVFRDETSGSPLRAGLSDSRLSAQCQTCSVRTATSLPQCHPEGAIFAKEELPARAKVSPARKKKTRKQKAAGDTYMTGIFCEPLFFGGGD